MSTGSALLHSRSIVPQGKGNIVLYHLHVCGCVSVGLAPGPMCVSTPEGSFGTRTPAWMDVGKGKWVWFLTKIMVPLSAGGLIGHMWLGLGFRVWGLGLRAQSFCVLLSPCVVVMPLQVPREHPPILGRGNLHVSQPHFVSLRSVLPPFCLVPPGTRAT